MGLYFLLSKHPLSGGERIRLLKPGKLCPACKFKRMANHFAIRMEETEVEGRMTMKIGILAVLAAVAALNAQAKDAPAYEKGVLTQMDSSACGYSEKDGKTIAGQIFGTDGQHKNTKQVLCQEYVLQADHIIYRITPKDDKHPVLLPVGETAQFRIRKDKLLLRVPEADGKEREYFVLSMTPRADVAVASRPAARAEIR